MYNFADLSIYNHLVYKVRLDNKEDRSNLLSSLHIQGFDPMTHVTDHAVLSSGLCFIYPNEKQYSASGPLDCPQVRLSANDLIPDFNNNWDKDSLAMTYDILLKEYQEIEKSQVKRKEELDLILTKLNNRMPDSLIVVEHKRKRPIPSTVDYVR